jgi:NCS1 family nucleobase:cation symporter-1
MTADSLPQAGSMPTREGDMTIEGHGIEPIPASARYGSVNRVFTVWFTPNLVPAAFAIGLLAAADFLQVGFVTGLAGIIVGNIVGAALVGLLATMGPKTGMAQLPVARLPFGKTIVLPGLLNWLSCIGWDGVNSVFGAAAISILTGLDFVVSLLIIVAFQGALGIIGHEAIQSFEKWMAIVLGVMFIVVSVSIFGQASTGMARTDGFTDLDQLGAFILWTSITASFVLAWGLYASDYTRYLPAETSGSRIFWWTVLGLALSAGWIETLGLLVADQASGGAVDTINNLLSGSFLAPLAMIAIGIGTVAVNGMNDYTGSLSLLAAGVRVPRVASAAVVAVLAFFFTLYLNSGDFTTKFESYLLFVLYWVAAWAGVVVADWWKRGRKADVSILANFSNLAFGWQGLLALLVGYVASIPFQTSEYGYELANTIPIFNAWSDELHYADIAFVVGFAVSFIVYWIIGRTGSTATETGAASESSTSAAA